MAPRSAVTFAFAALIYPAVALAQAPADPGAGTAQVAQYDAPAYVAAVDGAATIERDGRIESAPLNMPLLSGDRLRTTDGRVDVQFADGGHLFLDRSTTLDLMSDDLVRLAAGRVRIVEARQPAVSYRIDSVAGSARLLEPGEYRVALLQADGETQLELAVLRGAGEISTDQGKTPVQAGERAYASAGMLPSYAYAFNSASADDFDRWADQQRGAVYADASPSSQYLPQDMTGYASTFDQYGDWRYQQEYGYVWYPRVATDWRPYYYGRWATYPSYGWTWIAADPFGYPTHHYGRWGFSAGVWFWIPSRHWGPAYVSWGYAGDYVSWCPLGWNNRAVFSINIFNVGPRYYSAGPRYYSAWTVVPRARFGHGYAYQHAVQWDRSASRGGLHFTEGRAPAFDRAVTRRAAGTYSGPSRAEGRSTGAPLRYAGTRATAPGVARAERATVDARPRAERPRGESPRYINRGNAIVRSQTERPTAPRVQPQERARAPRAAEGARQPYAWDRPSYRPPANTGRTTTAPAPAYRERAVPRSEVYQPRSEPTAPRRERSAAPYAPSYDAAPHRAYEPAARPSYTPPPAPQRPSQIREHSPMPSPRGAPSGGDRAVPRPSNGGHAAPSRGEGHAAGGRSRSRGR